jgi:hypothetical protein
LARSDLPNAAFARFPAVDDDKPPAGRTLG